MRNESERREKSEGKSAGREPEDQRSLRGDPAKGLAMLQGK